MDLTTTLNLAAIAISFVALAISAFLGMRQVRVSDGSNQLPVILDSFRQSRHPSWFAAEEFVLNDLPKLPPAHGKRNLPPEALGHIDLVGPFFDDLGKLVAHGIVTEKLIIGAYGTMIVRLWDALAPFVYAERELHQTHFWIYFEHLAALTAATDLGTVYGELRTHPPRPTHA